MKSLDTQLKVKNWLDKHEIENYFIHNDLTVDVDGSVRLDMKKLEVIPIQFGIVKKDFSISGNGLTSLKGSPQEVGGFFDCSHNYLTNLEYIPSVIGDDLRANQNQLTHIEHLAHCVIRRRINLSYNKITSLVGSPEEARHHFDCSYNELTDLVGGPKIAPDHYYCTHNKLTSLKGAPEIVHGNFDISYNELTSLEYLPKKIWEEFDASNNQINDISHLILSECMGNIDISHNKLTSLKGSPLKVVRNFDCSFNQLSSLENGPIEVGLDYICESNELKSLIGVAHKISTLYAQKNQISSLIEFKDLAIRAIDLGNNNISTLKDINPNLHLINIRGNPIEHMKEILFLSHIPQIMLHDFLNAGEDISLYSKEDTEKYMAKIQAYFEHEQFNATLSLRQEHKKMKI